MDDAERLRRIEWLLNAPQHFCLYVEGEVRWLIDKIKGMEMTEFKEQAVRNRIHYWDGVRIASRMHEDEPAAGIALVRIRGLQSVLKLHGLNEEPLGGQDDGL